MLLRSILMLNSKYHKECFQECLSLVRNLVSGTSFELLIQQQDIRESIKKGLVIFFLKAAVNQEERHEVIKMFNQDFKDERLKQEMLREYVQLNGVVQRYG